ncbi:MAG: hypothetical protein DRJ61_11170 [Acidobacteria bacterium]|nr:MAG: hypothetical protein DRJ61_11170 [Acidobacteriota bacterium]
MLVRLGDHLGRNPVAYPQLSFIHNPRPVVGRIVSYAASVRLRILDREGIGATMSRVSKWIAGCFFWAFVLFVLAVLLTILFQ